MMILHFVFGILHFFCMSTQIKNNEDNADNFKSYSKTAFYANGIMANPRKDFHMAALTHWAFQTILYAFGKHSKTLRKMARQ